MTKYKKLCPHCGREWKYTSAKKSLLRKYGTYEFLCVSCGKPFTVTKNKNLV